MNNPAFRPLIVVFAVVLVMAGFSLWRNATQPTDPTPWRATLDQAKQESKSTGKPVLAYFTASWCGPCQRMKHDTWPSAAVQTALARFIPVKIDVDASHDIAVQFAVENIPRIQIIAPDGTPGRAHIGGLSASELAQWLESP